MDFDFFIQKNRRRNLECSLTREEVELLRNQICFYCGNNERSTIDRVHSDAGYCKDNAVASCVKCNTIKGSAPVEACLMRLCSGRIDVRKRKDTEKMYARWKNFRRLYKQHIEFVDFCEMYDRNCSYCGKPFGLTRSVVCIEFGRGVCKRCI